VHATEWDRDLLAETLRTIMDAAELNQADVGVMAGRARTMVSRWLSGEHRPEFNAASNFTTALARQHPDMTGLARQFMAAAGYPERGGSTASAETAGAAIVRQLRAMAASERKTVGQVLIALGIEARELEVPEEALPDPIIEAIEADTYLDRPQKDRMIDIYLKRRAELFEAEYWRRQQNRRLPGA
jgi:transcriptional regulator with XRE-family HTH domain